jgi:hypothetical protein
MSLEQLMALAARLSSPAASPVGQQAHAGGLRLAPRQVSLTAQEWAELFPECRPAALAPAAIKPVSHRPGRAA